MPASGKGVVALWGSYLRLLDRKPLRTNCTTSCFLFMLSQVLSQMLAKGCIVSGKKVRDFGIWGLLMPLAARNWQDFMAFRGPKNMFVKIAFDHVCYRIPIMVVFNIYNRLMEGGSLSEAWVHVKKTEPGIQWVALKLWPTVNLVNFTVVPLPLRVLYQNVVLLFWAIYLAVRMRKDQQRTTQELRKTKSDCSLESSKGEIIGGRRIGVQEAVMHQKFKGA
eukprot:gnl/TRDRNA2_/TRDRNA2_191069_c0_seq1.p1 gnl/TRDRNA2_/TRDRNA2_191069_c0~~gnl/TRDRNA2_/TRDRNA2_191069_c0_seq1.p1  ORF type:complete len:221 (-),score=25.36 gnl/TRDRNA2_/TRDRNA2_191069_c0_seq1:296-958(-)